VAGASTLTGAVAVVGALVASSTANLQGAVDCDTTLNVDGVASLVGGGVVGTQGAITLTEALAVQDDDIGVINTGSLGSECLSEGNFATHANWDVATDGTSAYVDSGGNAEYTWDTGAATATLTQVLADQAGTIRGSRWYKLVYTVAVTTAPDGDSATELTNAVAAVAQPLDITAGTKTLYFKTKASPADFVISTVDTTATAGQFTIDDISLKEVIGGDLYVGGNVLANTLNLTGAADVVGAVTAGSTVDITGALVSSSTADLQGAVTAGSTVDITGKLTCSGDVDIQAALNLQSTTITAAGPTDNHDMTGCNIVTLDATSNDVTLGGFVNGVADQVAHVVIINTTNDVIVEHAESTGNQDIYLNGDADKKWNNTYGGVTLVCNGTHWYEVGGVPSVLKTIDMNAPSFAQGATGPDAASVGNYSGWSYDINDDSNIVFDLPDDWMAGTDLTVYVDWAIDENYSDDSGEVRWNLVWTATAHAADEDASAAGTTIDYGDQNLPAADWSLMRSSAGVISGASLAAGDAMGMKLKRVAIAHGNGPTADPVALHLHIDYTAKAIGSAL